MKKFIITISREFGCNAREVARKAAAELGVEFYDKDLCRYGGRACRHKP